MPQIRAIDIAMRDDRPAKQCVRKYWLHQTKHISQIYKDDDAPLYLTLSGAKAKDIIQLINEGLIETTEVGSISESCQNKIAAVEKNSLAVSELQARFPGLKIFNQPLENILKGNKLTRYPEGEHERWCRARVINLDFDSPLECANEHGETYFPALHWVKKLAQLHAAHPRINWCLYLTFNSSISWPLSTCNGVRDFLLENFEAIPQFSTRSREILGDDFYSQLISTEMDFGSLAPERQQKLLMIFVPKKIAQLVRDQGWRISTYHNLRYGGVSGQAPMVTWVLCFEFDDTSGFTPDLVYRDSVKDSLSNAGLINEDGLHNSE